MSDIMTKARRHIQDLSINRKSAAIKKRTGFDLQSGFRPDILFSFAANGKKI